MTKWSFFELEDSETTEPISMNFSGNLQIALASDRLNFGSDRIKDQSYIGQQSKRLTIAYISNSG